MLLTASVVSAVLLGWFFILAWQYCIRRLGPAQFWTTLYRASHELLRVEDPARLLQIYRTLFAAVGRYLAGNLAGIAIGLLPVVLLFYFAVPAIDKARETQAGSVEVYPDGIGELQRNKLPLPRHAGTTRALYDTGTTEGGELVIGTTRHALDRFTGKTAICWSAWTCALLDGCGFRVIESATRLSDQSTYLVVRTDYRRHALFWPFLNDIESVFMLVFLLTNTAVYVILKRRTA